MKILIDNGHGNNTPGKRSPIWSDGSQLFEHEFNRDITLRLVEKLKTLKIPFEVIVPEVHDVSLTERCKRINSIAKKEACLLVSIHANAGGGKGWEAWTSPGITKSDKYAESFYNKAKELLPSRFPIRKCLMNGYKNKEALFKILTGTTCPAVLTENMFMDTESDCNYIMSDSGRETIAELHLQAILEVLKK